VLTAAEFASVEGMVKGDILGASTQPDAGIPDEEIDKMRVHRDKVTAKVQVFFITSKTRVE